MEVANNINCKPFLRWAGGKKWLIKHLDQYLPESFNNYHEPFIGGGSILLNLQPEKAFISDLNPELTQTYKEVKLRVDQVISKLAQFENTKECYYDIRATSFKNASERAARFIFLNQTSFNGIYRVNLKGEYNVPYGNRVKNFFEPENLRAVSQVLKPCRIRTGDFTKSIKDIQENDLVFLDPPYTVTHNNNGFIKYNSKLFHESSQLRLSKFIDEIEERGAYYILTNAAHEWVRATFEKEHYVQRIEVLDRVSLIGGKNATRGKYSEYIFTNINL